MGSWPFAEKGSRDHVNHKKIGVRTKSLLEMMFFKIQKV